MMAGFFADFEFFFPVHSKSNEEKSEVEGGIVQERSRFFLSSFLSSLSLLVHRPSSAREPLLGGHVDQKLYVLPPACF
jgi:hypothetical protein